MTERELDTTPRNVDIERVILGSIILDNETFFDDITDLSAEDFSLDSHQIIFRLISEILFGIVDDCEVVDLGTLIEQLRKRKQLSSVGGSPYIFSLTEGLPHKLNLEEYVKIVKEKALARRLISICSSTIYRVEDQSDSASDIVASLQEQLLEEQVKGDARAVKIGEVAPVVEKEVITAQKITGERTAVQMTWGVEGLDALTKGAFGGEMTVCSGESGGGKSAFATQMMYANAKEGTPCAIFSIEMQKEKAVRRFFPMMSEVVTADHMRDPRLMNLHTHVPEMKECTSKLAKLPIWIDDTSPLQIRTLCARIQMMRRKFGIRLFVIDYLQLIEVAPSKQEGQEVKKVIFALRDLVKREPTVHLLVLSQYSKADGFIKKRKRTKGDLYGGSVIHHAAQNVLLISIEDGKDKQSNDLLDVEFVVDKQRDGRVGKATTMFDRDHLTFRDAQPLL